LLVGKRDFIHPLHDIGQRSDLELLSGSKFRAAAACIRGEYYGGIDEDALEDTPSDIVAWCDAMAEHCDGTLDKNLQTQLRSDQRTGYVMHVLLLTVRLADMLRQDSQVHHACQVAADLLGIGSGWLQHDMKVRKKATISKSRFTVDAGYTLMCQQLLDAMLDGPMFWLYMAADRSPRSGREWLFIHVWIVVQADALQLFRLMKELLALQAQPVLDKVAITRASKAMAQLAWKHVLVSVCCGARQLSLAAQFAACIHSFRLDCSTWDKCMALCGRILPIILDYGVESGFTSVLPCDLP
jgi:hypothetical protein